MNLRLSLVAALSVLGVAQPAGAWCRTTTSRLRSSVPGECAMTGIPLAWRNRCTGYSLYRAGVPAEIPWDELVTIAQGSAAAWAAATCDDNGRERQYYEVRELAPTLNPTGYTSTGANSNTISFRSRWGDDAIHRQGTIAITIVTFDSLTGEIYDGDIELNTFHDVNNPGGFQFSISRITDMGAADLQTILTHELGHFHGLAHSANDRAVMWPEAGLGETRRDLTFDDTAGVCAIYPASQTPVGVRCNPLPYGGLATYPNGTKVTGGSCAAGPSGGSLRAGVGVALVAACAIALKKRRGRRRRTTPGSP